MVTQKQLKRAQYNDVQMYNDAPSHFLHRQDTVALKVYHLLSNQGTGYLYKNCSKKDQSTTDSDFEGMSNLRSEREHVILE